MNFELWQEEMRKQRKPLLGKSNSYKNESEAQVNRVDNAPKYEKKVFNYSGANSDSYNELLLLKGKKINFTYTDRGGMTANTWNSFWVPFNLNTDQCVKYFGEGCKIYRWVPGAEGTPLEPVTSIEAGKAYIVRPKKTIDVLSFDRVTIPQDFEIHVDTYETDKYIDTVSPCTVDIHITGNEDVDYYGIMSSTGRFAKAGAGASFAGGKCYMTRETKDPYAGHSFVDLGLPSKTLWATMNVGANSETDAGLYFAWGETQGYADTSTKAFSLSDYKWSDNGSSSVMTKYNRTDGKTVLDIEDDAAHANWGGDWHMPTKEQCQELFNTAYVTNTWVTNYNGSGVDGRLFTSVSNGNTVFIPAAGTCSSGSVISVGDSGSVWASSRYSSDVIGTWYLVFLSGGGGVYIGNRCNGLSVRGVIG